MSLTPSTMQPLGSKAPDFELPDPHHNVVRLRDLADAPVLVVMFICNHCPYVKHIKADLAPIFTPLIARGAAVVAINSNDFVRFPHDRPEQMALDAERFDYPFPYLVDEDQSVARAYGAVCTPDFFVYDADQRLAYRGQFCEGRPGSPVPVTGRDLVAAVESLLEGLRPAGPQHPSMGCNIKWKA